MHTKWERKKQKNKSFNTKTKKKPQTKNIPTIIGSHEYLLRFFSMRTTAHSCALMLFCLLNRNKLFFNSLPLSLPFSLSLSRSLSLFPTLLRFLLFSVSFDSFDTLGYQILAIESKRTICVKSVFLYSIKQ